MYARSRGGEESSSKACGIMARGVGSSIGIKLARHQRDTATILSA